MNANIAYIIGGCLALLAIVAVLAGPNFRKLSLVFGKWFTARAEAEQAGPSIKDIDADGEGQEFKAKGSGAAISDVRARGKGNTFTAES